MLQKTADATMKLRTFAVLSWRTHGSRGGPENLKPCTLELEPCLNTNCRKRVDERISQRLMEQTLHHLTVTLKLKVVACPPPPPGLNIDPLAPGLQGQKKFDSNISNPMPSNIKAGGRRGEFDSL